MSLPRSAGLLAAVAAADLSGWARVLDFAHALALGDLAARFEGSEPMLVSYPGPEHRTFEEGMWFIRAKRWGAR